MVVGIEVITAMVVVVVVIIVRLAGPPDMFCENFLLKFLIYGAPSS